MPLRRKVPSRPTSEAALWAVLLSVCAACGLRADPVVLVLKNGDRVSGELVSEADDRYVVKSAVFGQVTITKVDVLRREAPSAAPAAGSTNAPTASLGTNAPAGGTNGPVLGRGPGGPALAGTNQPSAWAASFPAWLRPYSTNWHGNIQLGMNLGFGTAEQRTFYSNMTLTQKWDRVRNAFEYHAAYGSVNGVESANRMDGAFKVDVDLGQNRRLYVYDQGGGSYDAVRHINLEYHEGAGMGYKFIQEKTLLVNGELGVQYQHFDYLDQSSRDMVSARIAEDLTWKPLDKLVITQRLAYLPNLLNGADYRVRFDLIVTYPLFRKVALNLNLSDIYDSYPAVGIHNNDLEIQSTVGYTF